MVKFTDSFLGLHGVGPINASVSDTRTEWAFAPGWAARIEYLHADLGSVNDVGKSAVNYRWDGGPILAR